ncbi:MAG: NAD(P)-dependent alcohol dehydrogenase [Rhizobiaceae bacterium]|nr:NAD(P)-dependent alcohol dehydrogenase [Rhizobiaceae bacterium]
MKAAWYEKYGSADVVEIRDIARPEPKDNEILVQVFATTVTTADWRFRASAFPKIMWLAGRAMAGLFAPKAKVLGSEFAGRVVAKGKDVTKFKGGDEVMGFSMPFGAHAEYIVISEDQPVVKKPANIGYDEAAATPFGANTALAFLRDFAKVQPGQKVLISGASGGVGVWAVQIAKHLGAEVTAVTSTGNVGLMKSLGADRVIDYKKENYWQTGETWDLVLDTAGTTTVAHAKRALNPKGIFLPVEFAGAEMLQALRSMIFGGKQVLLRISGDNKENLATVAGLLESGEIRPVIDSHYSLEQIADAHRRVESRHKRGSVVVTVSPKALEMAKAA